MYDWIKPVEMTIKRWEEELKLKMYWDSCLEDYYKNFIVILNWLTFVNPQDDLMLVGSEQFEEYIEALNLANEDYVEKENYNPYGI